MARFEKFSIPINVESLGETATQFRVGEVNIWVCKSSNGVDVFFDECAHMGGELFNNGKNLVCPQHGWTYNFKGQNINRSSPGLRKAKVLSFKDSIIEVLLPMKKSTSTKVDLAFHSK